MTWTLTAAVISWTVAQIAYVVLGVHYPDGTPALVARWAPLVFPLLIAPLTTAPRVILQRRLREANEQLLAEIERRTVLQAELEYQATHDALTGVLNRRGFFERAAGAVEGGASLVALDLDRFKGINDTYGHAAGDTVLKAAAAALRAETDGLDGALIGRLGGDEFVVLVPAALASKVGPMGARLGRLTVSLPEGTSLVVSTSVGISRLTDGASIDAALARADQRMYTDKRRVPGRRVPAAVPPPQGPARGPR
jgi:diguanylate cyclase (GGDEF)-like protein